MKHSLKRLVAVVLCAVLSVGCMLYMDAPTLPTASAYASERISIQSEYCSYMTTKVTNAGTGCCQYSASVCLKSSADYVVLELFLQEYRNGAWTDIANTNKTSTLSYVTLTSVCSDVISGRNYRAKLRVKAYGTDGGVSFNYIYSSVVTAA